MGVGQGRDSCLQSLMTAFTRRTGQSWLETTWMLCSRSACVSMAMALNPCATRHAAEITSAQRGLARGSSHVRSLRACQATAHSGRGTASPDLLSSHIGCCWTRMQSAQTPSVVQVLPQDIREPLSCHYNRAYLLEVGLLC